MRKLTVFLAATLVALGFVFTSTAAAGTLATESGDWSFPGPTFTAVEGSSTVTGTLGPTPTDGQDPFSVTIPSTLKVTSVSYSGPSGPHNLVGCGLTGTSTLNQTFTTGNTSCTLSWFINTDFMVSATPWTVTIVTEAVATGDTEPPTITVPADITFGTTPGADTAVVSFSPTASDNVGVVDLTCSPASGSTFPLGTTTVTCTATDAAGNTASDSFNVTIVDVETPTITVPADITLLATGIDGEVATFTATATDNVGVADLTCSPASGSTFPVGTTTVTCTATDAAANTAEASFDVNVEVDSGSTWTLIEGIESLGLPTGVEKSLTAPLKNVDKILDDANPANDGAACNKLAAFLDHVADQLSEGNLTAAEAGQLTAFAMGIMDSLGC